MPNMYDRLGIMNTLGSPRSRRHLADRNPPRKFPRGVRETGLDWNESPSFTDSKEFKAYVREIDRIIRAAGPDGITTRGIHEQLAGNARRHWTQDSLDLLMGDIESFGALPTRYRAAGCVSASLREIS